jgi:hypothetical protein
MIWQAVQYVTGGLTFLTFIAAIALYGYRTRTRGQEQLLKSFSDDAGRVAAVQRALEYFDVDTAGLTKDQRYELALAQMLEQGDTRLPPSSSVCLRPCLQA